jgi:predicted transcriptional regulator
LWIDEENWRRLQAYAETTDHSASHHLREAVRLYLKVIELELLDKIFEDQRPEDEDTCI